MKVTADGVVDESLLELGFPSCLISEDNIIIPASFHLQQQGLHQFVTAGMMVPDIHM